MLTRFSARRLKVAFVRLAFEPHPGFCVVGAVAKLHIVQRTRPRGERFVTRGNQSERDIRMS
jgi:hypothetical protein